MFFHVQFSSLWALTAASQDNITAANFNRHGRIIQCVEMETAFRKLNDAATVMACSIDSCLYGITIGLTVICYSAKITNLKYLVRRCGYRDF